MDKSLFLNVNGAQNAMHQLEIVTNNLANSNTTAFRADATFVKQYPVASQGMQSRTFAKIDKTYTDFKQGPILNTDRELDIALSGEGFIAVQSQSGREGYTRSGNLNLNNGFLVTSSGDYVVGNAGVINIPPAERIHISPDGTVSAKFIGANDYAVVDRIKLTNPSVADVEKGTDALFYLTDGSAAPQDENVKIVTGALEGSNVNAIETMTKLIDLSRSYEFHTNFMKTIGDNTSKSNQLLELR